MKTLLIFFFESLSNISIFDDFLSKEESEESNEEEEERDLGTLKDNILSVMKSPVTLFFFSLYFLI